MFTNMGSAWFQFSLSRGVGGGGWPDFRTKWIIALHITQAKRGGGGEGKRKNYIQDRHLDTKKMNRASNSDGLQNRCRRKVFFIGTVNNNEDLYLNVSSGPK
jgi:hypothetical protein